MFCNGLVLGKADKRINAKPNGAFLKSIGTHSKRVLFVTLLTAIISSGICLAILYMFKTLNFHERNGHKAIELSGLIMQYDEVLTMSARMAAATGDIKWEERYRKYEPQLDNVIKEAISLVPYETVKRAVAATDTANIRLVEMENKAFKLVRDGKQQAAFELLNNPDYTQQKLIYANSTSDFINDVRKYIRNDQARVRYIIWGVDLFVVFILLTSQFLYFSRVQLRKNLVERSRLAAIIDSSDDAIIGKTLDGNIVSWNKGAEEMYGYSGNEIIGKPISILIPPGHKDDLQYISRQILIGENIRHYETVRIRKDGRQINVSLTISPIKDIDGRIIGISTIARDITEHKRAEEKVKRSQETLGKILELVPFGIIIVGKDKIVRQINKAALFIAGYKNPDEVTGRSCRDIFCLAEKDKCPIMDLGQLFDKSERTLVTKDGRKVPVLKAVTPIMLDDEEVLLESVIDITDIKEAEQKLRESEEKYKTLYESSRDAVMIASLKEGFLGGNPAAISLFGCDDLEEFISKTPADLSPQYQPDGTSSAVKAQEMMTTAMEKGSQFFEWMHKRVDGTEFFATVLLTRMELKGQKVLQATVRDITKQKQAENIIKQTQMELEKTNKELAIAVVKAENADKAKSVFLANMSHEIRTPMNSIVGFSDILSEEELTAQQKEYVNTIRGSCKHLLQLINDILDFSKIEAGKLKVEPKECSLKDTLCAIESMMNPLARKKGLEFRIQTNDNLPAHIYSDEDRLRQCLINLTGNAIKFTDNGHVYINTSLIDKNNQPYIRFDVEDTGIGIPTEKQHDVFEAFVQADGSTSRKYGGTGLGLTITRQLISLLGGEIKLASETGKGSVFSIMIPVGLDLTKQPMMGKYNVIESVQTGDKEVNKHKFSGNVLVAEDIEANQILIKLLLNRVGLNVTLAADGREAMQMALEQKFDLIFMDIQMPQMNGYEAVKALRKEGLKTIIIALTAHAIKGDDRKCLEAGFDDYLSKPIDRKKLLEKLDKYLPSERKISEDIICPVNTQPKVPESCDNQTCQQSRLQETSETEDIKEIINWNELIERVGDEELIKEIVTLFLKDSEEWFSKLFEAVKSQNSNEIKFYAHTIKGASANISLTKLSGITKQLEFAGRDKNFEAAAELVDKLRAEFDKVIALFCQPNWIEIVKQEKIVTAKVIK